MVGTAILVQSLLLYMKRHYLEMWFLLWISGGAGARIWLYLFLMSCNSEFRISLNNQKSIKKP